MESSQWCRSAVAPGGTSMRSSVGASPRDFACHAGGGAGWPVSSLPGRRFVVSWTAANIEDEPRIGDLHDHRVTFHENLCIEQRSIELPGAVLIGDDEKMRQNETSCRRWEVVLVHAKPLKFSCAHVARNAAWRDNLITQPGRSCS